MTCRVLIGVIVVVVLIAVVAPRRYTFISPMAFILMWPAHWFLLTLGGLVPALINLANIHYSHDELAEAQALYERAISIESDFFEAHFNLGNIYHDLGRFTEAQGCYGEALRLNPYFADAHFYLAVTFEKTGQSQKARPHWRAYQQLAPQGEWVALAKEFSE